jgi:hypothetical protein
MVEESAETSNAHTPTTPNEKLFEKLLGSTNDHVRANFLEFYFEYI